MKPQLIANENVPAPTVASLRARGVDVLAVTEVMPGASDLRVLEEACATGRWLVTFERDYGELVFSRRAMAPPAILYLRQEPIPPERPADWVMAVLDDAERMRGHLVVVGESGLRLRPLPAVFA